MVREQPTKHPVIRGIHFGVGSVYEVYDEVGFLKSFETKEEAETYIGGMGFTIKEIKPPVIDWEPLF